MATRTSRPWRTLVVFLLATVALFTGAASLGSWTPKLGLDLQGGQRITLEASASGGGGITTAKLDEAVGIISSRVNGAGVAEAEVSTQGNDIIIVEIPGKPDEDLARSIGSTAQLRFRLVAGSPLPPLTPEPDATPTPSTATGSTAPSGAPTTQTPTSGAPTTQTPASGGPSRPSTTPTSDGPGASQSAPSSTGSGQNRPAAQWLSERANNPAPTTSAPTDPAPTKSAPTDPAPTTPAPSTSPTSPAPTTASPVEPEPTIPGPPPALVAPEMVDIPDPYAWVNSPPPEWQQRVAGYDCTPDPSQTGQVDIPDQPLLACDADGFRYLLGPAMVDGTDVKTASAGLPQTGINYVVNLEFNSQGANLFGDVTTRIAGALNQASGQEQQLAIVLDGEVLSNPSNAAPITGGQAEISGSSQDPFTQDSATSLANSLKYGALPLSFKTVNVSNEGPQLAANQLDAGVLAGVIGIVLVLGYCILYYRALSVVIIASLLIAGLVTYASVLLLGHAYGFTLTLPGIAGLIVAVGITADSFIVYFERLRDEVRDGRTLRTSVETGWVRARTTILAADAISLLAAVVLFIFAIGVVKGFAFALGLSTLIDVFVVFFFTKPMVTLLSRTTFFGQGHKWSGLDRAHLGMPAVRRTPTAARGGA